MCLDDKEKQSRWMTRGRAGTKSTVDVQRFFEEMVIMMMTMTTTTTTR